MSSFLTPDVYTEEVPLLPQSVAGVSTAVPAFIGYTQKAVKEGKNVTNQAIRIATFLEYKEIFGMAQPTSFLVDVNNEETINAITVQSPNSTLYYAMDLYFKNGGGDCYIISVGSYEDGYTQEAFLEGLEILSKEDEPTLIMLGEAAKLPSADYYSICQQALAQCQELKDRFCVFDIQNEDAAAQGFREGIGANNLKYGAAYTPYLQTSLNYVYHDSDVNISKESASQEELFFEEEYQGIKITYLGDESNIPKFRINGGSETSIKFSISPNKLLTVSNVPEEGVTANELVAEWEKFENKENFEIIAIDTDSTISQTSGNSGKALKKVVISEESFTLDTKKGTALYSKIKSELAKEKIILPSSSAIAGVYATTDRERGVWKAPANVSLNAVIGPVKKITSKDQEKLNVDATAGKSINAIRSFVGKGTMVWGARTLAGNDNEWRYIPVRRLFNMIEESTKKASYFAVFEPNDAATWLKVKAMIESFLYGIWQQGGLAGATEEQAYFVNIGLGKTMTQQDILEGRMIVEIGIAAARPAEFIILKFSHKLQEV
ncbi:phage tail sheath family protein [Aquimarina algicola]|uniref:Phage tail sheath family protein n=1 Tax=Aquimarina algicola TaxID=2589995 RepID=A0A504JKJ3_9FLAO|nr:phage tail sheath C-terminal domain-containing protein [Aquimarina algicola]TPN87000.1 phage tail sheath family protein [Aquimarina algicola]